MRAKEQSASRHARQGATNLHNWRATRPERSEGHQPTQTPLPSLSPQFLAFQVPSDASARGYAVRSTDTHLARRTISSSVSSLQVGLLRYVHFYLNLGPEISARSPRGRVFPFLHSVELSKLVAFLVTWSHDQLNEGSNPKTGSTSPSQQKNLAKRQLSRWTGNEERPPCVGLTSQRPSTTCTTATARQLHSTSSQVLRLVQVFVWVVSRLWVMWVCWWHSPLKSLPQDPKKGWTHKGGAETPQRQSQQPSRLGLPKAVGQ